MPVYQNMFIKVGVNGGREDVEIGTGDPRANPALLPDEVAYWIGSTAVMTNMQALRNGAEQFQGYLLSERGSLADGAGQFVMPLNGVMRDIVYNSTAPALDGVSAFTGANVISTGSNMADSAFVKIIDRLQREMADGVIATPVSIAKTAKKKTTKKKA